MARKAKTKRGTPAGEVGRERKACGWKMYLDRRFIGRGAATRTPLVGNGPQTALGALRAAWEDAAAEAFDYVIAQYKDLRCASPCHKHWNIDFPRAANPNGAQVFAAVVRQFGLILAGGLSIEEAHISRDTTVPGMRFQASVTLKCNFLLECSDEKPDKPDPNPDQLLAAARHAFDLMDHLAGQLGK